MENKEKTISKKSSRTHGCVLSCRTGFRKFFNLHSVGIGITLGLSVMLLIPGYQGKSLRAEPLEASDEKMVERMAQTPPFDSFQSSPPVPSKTEPTPSLNVAELVSRGETVYQENCVQCHGIEGDGQGELANDLNPRPTNLVVGIYKFRSTPSGTLPMDEDLFRTISIGVPGTAMSDYKDLSEPDRLALVSYLKSLSSRFAEETLVSAIPFPASQTLTDNGLDRGKALYAQMHCAACHGESGKGNGPLAEQLTDPKGIPIRPANLTKRLFKSGKNSEAIYRTVMTGLDGTPMPSYGDSLEPEEGWDLAQYVWSLSKSGGNHDE